MRYHAFGSAGEVSVIGQGTWGLNQGDRRAVVEALQRGLDAGMSHIDTAEMYGEGKVEEVIADLAEIAEARGVSLRQVALAFLVRRSSLFAIPRTGRAAHAQENAAAADLDLSGDEIRRIDEAFPRGPRRRGVPTL